METDKQGMQVMMRGVRDNTKSGQHGYISKIFGGEWDGLTGEEMIMILDGT